MNIYKNDTIFFKMNLFIGQPLHQFLLS